MALKRTAKSCGPDTPTLVSSRRATADDGGKQARSPGRARRKPLKPLRGECRAISGVTVVTSLVCFIYFAREAAGALGIRHSLRPLFCWANDFCKNSDTSCRGIADPHLKGRISQGEGALNARFFSPWRAFPIGPKTLYGAARLCHRRRLIADQDQRLRPQP